MSSFELTVAVFAFWWLIGMGLLAAVRADTTSLRIVLTAPILGTCVTVLPLFVFSEAGGTIEACALPTGIVLALGAVLILAIRRPRVHAGAAAVAGTCVGCLPLLAWPAFSLGFRWLANGNEDMTNYVLSAQDLQHHGLLASMDFGSLTSGRDYSTTFSYLHTLGARPGSDMLLAFVSQVAGRPTYQMFMPVILAFNLCGACAVGALALQAARRWWAAVLAAGLLLVSPLASYGVVQQLIAQVWGLGLLVALCALLMRSELHGGRGPRARDVLPIGLVAFALVFGYPELIAELILPYLAYLAILARGKRLTVSALARLWLPCVAIVIVVLNSYFFTELSFLKGQSTHGLSASAYPPLFGYVLVPSGLPSLFGLQILPPGPDAHYLNLTIVLALAAIAVLLVASALAAIRGNAAALLLLAASALACLLIVRSGDFGIFKLMMYVQPFLAAFLATWIAGARRLTFAGFGAAALVLLIVVQVSRQHAYVKASLNPSGSSVPHLSASDVIPAFHSAAVAAHRPIVSVTENPVLIKLEAASAIGRTVYFQSRNAFAPDVRKYAELVRGATRARTDRYLQDGPWSSRSFRLLDPGNTTDTFEDDEAASRSLSSGDCELVIPSGSELPFNRLTLSSSHDLVATPCDSPHDLLAFTSSELGESFYLPERRRNVSFFQLEADPFYPRQTIVGFGRYALFRVLGPTPGARLEISLTESLTHDGLNQLPPAAVVGAARVPLPLEGQGSARVFSAPLTPQMIAGAPYLLLDMGVNGRLPTVLRSGLQKLYGSSVPTDPRYLTSYVRDVSLVGAAQYARLSPPLALSRFPDDLDNGALEYSGIYEDGWMGSDSFVKLAGGKSAELVLQGEIPAGAGKHLEVRIDGRLMASLPVSPGPLDVRVPVPASKADRRVELRFAATIRLAPPDLRPAAIHLSFLGFVPT
jgi:hypothetical protein